MLSDVLRSKRAVLMNAQIMRAFVKLREILRTHRELARKLAELERRIEGHDEEIAAIFEAIRQLMEPPDRPLKQIGFHRQPDEHATFRRQKSERCTTVLATQMFGRSADFDPASIRSFEPRRTGCEPNSRNAIKTRARRSGSCEAANSCLVKCLCKIQSSSSKACPKSVVVDLHKPLGTPAYESPESSTVSQEIGCSLGRGESLSPLHAYRRHDRRENNPPRP